MKKLLVLLVALVLAAELAPAQTVVQCLIAGVWVPCSMAPQPQFAQAPVSNKSAGSVASINAPYGSNTVKGNTLVVAFANGNINNPTAPITDTLSLKWFKAVQVPNSTFESEIWYAPNTVGGADTVTVTPGGTNASIAMMIYEVPGLVYPAAGSSPTGPQAGDQTTFATGSGLTSPSALINPIVPNEYVFAAFGLGTAAQSITVASPYSNDTCPSSPGCSSQNPGTPSGLFSFVSASLFKPEINTSSPSATIGTSEPWAVAVASFKTLTVPVQGTVQGLGQFSPTPPSLASAQVVAAQADSSGSLYVNTEGRKTTYEASQNGKTSVNGVSFYISGSSTKTVRITRIRLTYIATTTTVAYHIVTLQRYSALSGGTNNAVTAGSLDTNNAAATAAVDQVSVVNSTQTTIGGVLRAEKGVALSFNASAATSGIAAVDWVFPASTGSSQDLVLRGTSDFVGVTFDDVTAVYNIWVDWTEE